MCGFNRGGGGGGGEPAKKQSKLGSLTTQIKSDVLILINFIPISFSHCKIYV